MKIKILILTGIIFFLSSGTSHAKKTYLLLKLQKGATYEMATSTLNLIDQDMMGQKIQIEQVTDMVVSYQVIDVLPNGNYLIEYALSKIKLQTKMNGQETVKDSEGTDNNPLKGLIENKLKIEISPKGEISKVEGIEEFAKKFAFDPQLAQALEMYMNEKNLKSSLSQSLGYFNENVIKVGNKWSSKVKIAALKDAESEVNYEVVGIAKNVVSLKLNSDLKIDAPIEQLGFKMDMKANAKSEGTMTVDASTGWLMASEMKDMIDMKMKFLNPQTGEDMVIPMVMNIVIKSTGSKK
jgi:hypothetical protein